MKLDRLLGIVTILLQRDTVTAPYLAQKFEVARRTIGRDIDALCRAGIPIVTRQGSGGGISIAEGYKLDKSVLTADELSGIITALKGLGSVSKPMQIERTLDKLGVKADTVLSLREPVIIDLASHYQSSLTEKIALMKHAVLERQLIAFDYCYEKGNCSRCIEPYFVIFQWTSWYVFGYCLQREDWRLFKLNRLSNLRLADESYSPREIPPDKQDFGARMPDSKPLVALFDPSAEYRLVESYGPNCYTKTEGGQLLLESGYTNVDYTLNWLLGFGAKAQVLEPPEIAIELREIARNILALYE